MPRRHRHSLAFAALLVALAPAAWPQAAALDAAAQPDADAAVEVRVELLGIDEPLESNVRLFLDIAELETGWTERFFAGRGDDESVKIADIHRRHRAAPEQIRQALMPFGYYRPAIDGTLEAEGSSYTARYRVEPGEPTLLGEVNVQVTGDGHDGPALQEALAGVELVPGERLVHARYAAAKTALFDAAYDNGYLDAAWRESAIRVSADRSRADIDLVLETGPRFFFGPTRIDQTILSDKLINGLVDIEEGAPYDVATLLDLQRALSETDYFRHIEIDAPRAAADAQQRVPVTIKADAADSQRYSMGLGYGTDTGPRAKLGVLFRRLNQHGHRMRADVQVSSIEQAAGLRYEIPIRNYAEDVLAFWATARHEEIGDADTDRISLGASQIVDWLGFRRRLYVQADREQFSFGDGPTEETDLVYPGITLNREVADDIQYPRRGYSLRADLHAGFEDVLSDVSFSRFELAANAAWGFLPRTRLLLRAEAGILWTDAFSRLPPSQRFFAGGDRSIRGYPYREVGPEDAAGNVIGGERLLAGSIELERLLYGNFGAALFVDAGDAFDAEPDIKVGAGAGMRWRSPIGMVRFDVAHPFDSDDDYRIHLTLGADL